MANLLYVDIVTSIESKIINEELSVGSKLPSERELALQFEVSRNVVREAIKVLHEKGYVDIQIGRGVFVTKPNPKLVSDSLVRVLDTSVDGLEDILEVREVIELAVIKRVVKQATDEHIQLFKKIYEEMELKKYDVNEYIESDERFHLELAKATKNNVFGILSTSFSELSKEIFHLTRYNPLSINIAQEQHWKLIEAIESRDVHSAEKVMSIHIQTVREDIQLLKKYMDGNNQE